ncbi:MAG: hypothetical protein KA533_07415 [Sphingobium sp.]|nr:hypothetical protein [Sphingobium sp.]MBP8671611.1 hypothetical protein [Sphingobium sp.]MBP9158625.1 hypothetical protein [Sphingobium sp.]
MTLSTVINRALGACSSFVVMGGLAAFGGGGVVYDYLVTNDAQWAATFGLPDATLAGKAIALSGTFSNKVILNRPATLLRIVSLNAASKARLVNPILQSAKNISLEFLEIASPSTTSCLIYRSAILSGYLENIYHYYNDFIGSYEGVIDNPALDIFDPQNPHYACVVPTFTAGVLTGLASNWIVDETGANVPLSYVGGLVADGTGYSFTFTDQTGASSGGISWPGAGVKPQATFDVVGGWMQNFVIVSGGSGAVDETGVTPANGQYRSGKATSNIQWTGWAPMANQLPYATEIDTAGIGGLASPTGAQVIKGTLRYEGCTGRMVSNGFKHQAAEIQETILCSFDQIYQDAYAFSVAEGNISILHLNNHTQGIFSADGHPGDPHADALIQLFPITAAGVAKRTKDVVVDIRGNTVLMNNLWSNAQGIFIRMNYSQGTIPKVSGVIANNIVLSRIQTNGIQIDQTKNLIVHRNLVRHANPSDTDIGVSPISLDVGTVAETVLVSKNIAEKYPTSTGTGTRDTSTYPNATTNATTPFAAYSLPTSRADIFAKVVLSGSGQWTDANYGPLGGGHDFSANAPAPDDVPAFASFPILTEQAANGAAVDSAWAPLLGANGTIVWSGDRNVQFADDAAGTNATAGATSGSHVHSNVARKYIRTSAIKSTSGRATTSSNVTLNGAARPFYTITAAVTAYPTVNNGAAAVSRWDKTGTLSGICKGIIARRTLINTNVNNGLIVGGKTTSAFENKYVSSGVQERMTLISSTAHAARFDMGSQPTGQWLDDLIMFDWTKDPAVDGQDAVCQMVRNFQRKTLNSTGTTLNTISGTRTTDLTGIFGGSAPQGLGVFGLNNGTLPCDRQAEWFWFYFETNPSSPLPDITDPFVAAKFGADNFGGSGNAGGALPTPHLFFHAVSAGASEWNAGLPNLGSLGGTLGLVTGTYT